MRLIVLHIGLLFCLHSYSQEFGQQFFTIGEESLPKSYLIENSRFVQQYGLIDFNTKSIGISEDNYWNAVSMTDAYAKEEAYLNRRKNVTQKVINSETLGFGRPPEKEKTIRVEIQNRDYIHSNRFMNTVYRDASTIPYYLNPYYYNRP